MEAARFGVEYCWVENIVLLDWVVVPLTLYVQVGQGTLLPLLAATADSWIEEEMKISCWE